MNRQEQIIKAAKKDTIVYTERDRAMFLEGAQWADDHPDIDVRTMAAWKSGYQAAIDAYSHWISVEEELPQCNIPYEDCWRGDLTGDIMESEKVVVLTKKDGIHIATLNQNYDVETNEPRGNPYWFDENKPEDGDWINDKVTHWMKLPKNNY